MERDLKQEQWFDFQETSLFKMLEVNSKIPGHKSGNTEVLCQVIPFVTPVTGATRGCT